MQNFLISLIFFYLYTILKYRKAYYMLQQNWYNMSNRYGSWIFKNIRKVFITYELILLPLLWIITFFCDKVILFNLLIFFFCFILELKKVKKEQHKKRFVITARVQRLIFTTFLIFLLLHFGIYYYFDETKQIWYYLLLYAFSYLSFLIVYIINIINMPIERYVYHYYKKRAIKNLNQFTNIEVIGITGSYGKTSSKTILKTLLEAKFNAYATPKSFNTPYGLMGSINNGITKFDDYFIAEMGASAVGQIKELCDLVHPKYGILTTIGVAHLETFKTEENIIKTKFELIESLPKDGIAILNRDDKNQVEYKRKNTCKTIWYGIENDADVRAINIEISKDGTSFDVVFKGNEKKYPFHTVLLGEHNIYNILSAIALAYHLGVEIEKLQNATKMIEPITHRLELKTYNDVCIIDDAYNSNPTGSKMAVEVLNRMPGKKIIVTPGMIELGAKEYEYNYAFGQQLALVCDEIILVGENRTKPIQEGIKSKDSQKQIYIINDVKEAFQIIQKIKEENTYVLLENDLPDLFTE